MVKHLASKLHIPIVTIAHRGGLDPPWIRPWYHMAKPGLAMILTYMHVPARQSYYPNIQCTLVSLSMA